MQFGDSGQGANGCVSVVSDGRSPGREPIRNESMNNATDP